MHLDAHACEDVPLPAAVQLRGAAALDAKELAVLRPRGDLQRHGTFGRLHVDLAAERSRRVRHRDLHDEVVAAPLIRVRGRYAREDDEVTGWTAVLPRLALALQANARAVLDTRLDLHRVRLDAALAP